MILGRFLFYLAATFSAFVVNIIPVFAPPTWIVLSLYKVNHPELNGIAIALFGVVGSVAGRFVMYLYSKVLGRYIPQKYLCNVNYFRNFMEKKKFGIFIGSFIYSLSPLPSNCLFIGSGISGLELVPVLLGFGLGRIISYVSLVYAFYRTFYLFGFLGIGNIRLAADLFGVFAAVAVIFINWEKVLQNNIANLRIFRNKLANIFQ